MRPLLLHRLAGAQDSSRTLLHLSILHLVRLSRLGILNPPRKRSPQGVCPPHLGGGSVSRIFCNGRLGFLPRPDSLHYQSRLDMEGRRRILWRTILQLSRLVIHRLHLLPAFRAVPAEAWIGRPESSTTSSPLSPSDHTLPVDRSRVCPRLLVHVPQHLRDRCSWAFLDDRGHL